MALPIHHLSPCSGCSRGNSNRGRQNEEHPIPTDNKTYAHCVPKHEFAVMAKKSVVQRICEIAS